MLSRLSGWPLMVVVAGGRAADIYTLSSPSASLERIETIPHEDATLREQDRVSDRPGRAFDSMGTGRHSMEPSTSQKRLDEKRFAARIAAFVDRSNTRQNLEQLAIIAAPRLLGVIRAALGSAVRSRIGCEISKDLTQQSVEDIKRHIVACLPPGG